MSLQQTTTPDVRLVKSLLAPFGPIIQKVACMLCQYGPQTSNTLSTQTGFPLKRIKEALLVLFHHQLIRVYGEKKESTSLTQQPAGPTFYILNKEALHHRMHYAQWLVVMKNRDVPAAQPNGYNEPMLNIQPDILVAITGKILLHTIIQGTSLLKEFESIYPPNIIEQHLLYLMNCGFLVYYEEKKKEEAYLEDFTHPDYALFQKTNVKRSGDASADILPTKRGKWLPSVDLDNWLTFDARRFYEEIRGKQLELYFSCKLNASAGKIFSIIFESFYERSLDLSHESCPTITLFQIAQKIPPGTMLPVDSGMLLDLYHHPQTSMSSSIAQQLKEYLLAMISLSDGILTQTDDRSNFSITYNPKAAKKMLSYMAISKYIEERLGSSSVRLWRCILKKGFIEEKHMSKIVLVDLKSVREKLLTLFSHGLIELQDVPRTADHHPQRTIYLWKMVDEPLLFQSFKTLVRKGYLNLMERYEKEKKAHELLLSHFQSLSDEQAAETATKNEQERKLYVSVMRKLSMLEQSAFSLVPLLSLLE